MGGLGSGRRRRSCRLSLNYPHTAVWGIWGGTGLGLAISNRLCEMMGWTMTVDNEVGSGSSFNFNIVAQAAPSPARLYLRGAQPQLKGRRVLIVDDNATNRRILNLQTGSWGRHGLARGGITALEWVTNGDPFDVAILDMDMPEMDGLTLANEIQRYRGPKQLPLVMLTSLRWRSAAPSGTNEPEFAAFLTKPVKPSQLYDVLIQLFLEQVPAPKEPAAKGQFDPHLAERLPLRIVLAEDNVVNQKAATKMLERLGYRVDIAGNGIEAIQALERQPHDVVPMDIQMRDMDGLAASREICRRWPREARPIIVAMTANAMQSGREERLQAGMDDYISKPVQTGALRAALERAGSSGPKNRAAETPGAINKTALASLRDIQSKDGGDIVEEIVDRFLVDAPINVSALRRAVENGAREEIRRLAHTLKSSCACLGAGAMSEICGGIERRLIGRAGPQEPLPLASSLEAEFYRVRNALDPERSIPVGSAQ